MAAPAQDSEPQPDNADSTAADNVNTNDEPTAHPEQPAPSSSSSPPHPQTFAPPSDSATKTTTTTITAPPASPPLPQRPVALTPGARAQRLQKLFDSTLTHTLAKITLDNFAACYPTIAAQSPSALQSLQAGLVQRMAQLCSDEFAKIMARNEVVARLNELESLVGDATLRRKAAQPQTSRRKGKGRAGEDAGAAVDGQNLNTTAPPPTPPHLLSAEAVLAAHLAPHLASQQSQLNARLQNMQAANAGLWEAIAAQRAEIDGLLVALEAALTDVDGAAELMDGVPAEELAVESRAMEAEMVEA
ncbi:unnamed protein product [Discula destructiva]